MASGVTGGPRAWASALPLVLSLWGVGLPAQAGLPEWAACPTPPPAPAAVLDTHLQLAALIQQEWQRAGAPVALIARSGLNLRSIGHRYSHAGFLRPGPTVAPAEPQARTASVKATDPATDPAAPAAVRQLYFDCPTARPRVFDEGLAGFVRGVDAGALPRLSTVWWPPDDAPVLARAVADDALAVTLLSPHYQAQAHVWSLQSQNCNQWLVEMLGAAFGGARDRPAAQQWLRDQGYTGSVVQLPWVGWLLAAAVWPHMGLRDHPTRDLQALQLEVSMPASVEHFVRARWPRAQRVEWCLRDREVVVRRSWTPLDEACTAGPQDERVPLAGPP